MGTLKTGISGLDEMLCGGIPQGHTVAVLGSPGTGKSTLVLQYIYTGLQNDENCVYLSLEESENNLMKTAMIFGWDLKPYIDNKKLTLVNFNKLNFREMITRFESDLPKLLKSLNIKRLVIDPITLYEMIYDTESERRDHLFNFSQVLKETGITVVMTSEISKESPYSSKYGLLEYITDGVIIMQQVRHSDLTAVTNVIEVLKMRHIDHSKEIKSYSITKNGIVVHSGSGVFI
ncbi:MAG: KaiC domain-containing protein [Euryarchaeota archaeon]|nr:KaiC domain-containing protein [Euryarchaeota archaeon]MDP3104433.1 KaiC domain-containing protein [Candidatus Methanoperedens sp.]